MTASKQQNKMPEAEINNFRKKILNWYDKHQRSLPWRAVSNSKMTDMPNAYYVWLSEVMLQQTTVVTVGPYFQKFTNKWPTIHDLAGADKEDVMHEWAGLGYYARARNLHKCAQVVSHELNGVFPDDQKDLEKLPGIGGYTSAAVRAIAFNKPANVVDGNIERVMARVFAVQEPMPQSKSKLKELAGDLSINRADRPGDYAQALMDLGATICTPKSPKCFLCPIKNMCQGKALNIAQDLPIKSPKKKKPQKKGFIYWIENNKGEILFERRPETLMLGGMLGLPTSEWLVKKPELPELIAEDSKNTDLVVKHSFTHFDITLEIYKRILTNKSDLSKILPENNPIWVSRSKVDGLGLPTLFTKAIRLMK